MTSAGSRQRAAGSRSLAVSACLIAASCQLLAASAFGLTGRGGTSVFPFLAMNPGARAAAMGEAFSSYGEGVDSLAYNPAGLADLSLGELSFSHGAWFQDISYENFSLAVPVALFKLNVKASFGISYSMLRLPEITRTELDSGFSETPSGIDQFIEDAGQFSVDGHSLELALGSEINDFLDVGLKVRFPRQNVAEEKISATSFDLGTIATAGPGMKAALVIKNLGTSVHGSDLPTSLTLGGMRKLYRLSGWDDDLTFAGDVVLPIKPSSQKPRIHLGLEYARKIGTKGVALRAGYRHGYDLGALAGLTFGGGLGLQVGRGVLRLDYAFAPQGELGTIHRISMATSF